MSVTSQPQPAKANRIAALDILRGIAILGTLGTNIWVFAAAGTPLVEAFVHTRLTIQGFFEVFCNGKFLSLLSILFGVGVAIQYDAAQRRGREWPGHYLWRSTLLFLEGLFHFTLLFEGDVLMGLCGSRRDCRLLIALRRAPHQLGDRAGGAAASAPDQRSHRSSRGGSVAGR
jgi:uncharacterized protein